MNKHPINKRNATTSHEQLNALLDFLAEHRYLACGRLRDAVGRVHAKRLWQEITEKLNSMGNCEKKEQQWMKIWSDKKYKAKKNLEAIRSISRIGGKVPPLSETDKRVLSLLCDDCGDETAPVTQFVPLRNTQQNYNEAKTDQIPAASNTETNNEKSSNAIMNSKPETTSDGKPVQRTEVKHVNDYMSGVEKQPKEWEMVIKTEIIDDEEDDVIDVDQEEAGRYATTDSTVEQFPKYKDVQNFSSAEEMAMYSENKKEMNERKCIKELKNISSTLQELVDLVKQYSDDGTISKILNKI